MHGPIKGFRLGLSGGFVRNPKYIRPIGIQSSVFAHTTCNLPTTQPYSTNLVHFIPSLVWFFAAGRYYPELADHLEITDKLALVPRPTLCCQNHQHGAKPFKPPGSLTARLRPAVLWTSATHTKDERQENKLLN